ncbi:hypothetical protein HPB48_000256 [Haemaphysalis longicornis]|uniref:Uncharacterized protein n=1 Tax=Haemaphysalis longicornis TaxID=44386 RepID=A0A9J6GQI0_HAELO|nr:hypothetical protein HPB48_000256 [Haemaphysalis longicornis]
MNEFAERCTTFGVIISGRVKCLAFHRAYDFGYLLKGLIEKDLPPKNTDFLELHDMYFPTIYDIKCIMSDYPVPGEAWKIWRVPWKSTDSGDNTKQRATACFPVRSCYARGESTFLEEWMGILRAHISP